MRRTFTFLMLLAISTMAGAFDFSVAAPTGQLLYFSLTSASTVKVVAPGGNTWEGYAAPAGRLRLPATVEHEGATYSVAAIDRMAFLNCTALTSVTLPEGVATIGMRAFANDEALTSVFVGEGLQAIDMMAFMSCTALDTIDLPSSLTRIAASAFENTGYYNNPDNWSSTLTLNLGPWLLKVANTASDELVVAEGTVGVANNAFYYCRYLRGVTLPSTLRFVGDGAFQECALLDTLRLRSDLPPALGSDAFANSPVPSVVVPCGRLSAYASSAQWGAFPLVEGPCNPSAGLRQPDAPQVEVLPLPEGVLVRRAEGQPLMLLDAVGRCVASVPQASGEQRVALPAPGLYLLRVGRCPSLKISYLR